MTRPRPQRLVTFAPPGSLLKRVPSPVPRVRVKCEGERDGAYLAMVRELPCLKCGQDPCGEAAHVRYASAAHGKASGMGKRPPDRFAVSLCRDCHLLARDAQHKRCERGFWIEIDLDPLLVAERLYAKRGDLVAMKYVVMCAIAGPDKIDLR